jgi:hypothetical protein
LRHSIIKTEVIKNQFKNENKTKETTEVKKEIVDTNDKTDINSKKGQKQD